MTPYLLTCPIYIRVCSYLQTSVTYFALQGDAMKFGIEPIPRQFFLLSSDTGSRPHLQVYTSVVHVVKMVEVFEGQKVVLALCGQDVRLQF